LFIVRELVKAHGGRVEVTSTDEMGTAFSVVFPRDVD
jgi:signal transduction histidine kinase